MSNPTVILNGDQVYCDELIRENARLTIQHEADRLTLEQMRKQCVSSEECTAKVAEAYAVPIRPSGTLRRLIPSCAKPLRTCILSWLAAMPARCVPSSALLARATANPCGVERMVLICDLERTVPALLPQPGDRDGQKAPP